MMEKVENPGGSFVHLRQYSRIAILGRECLLEKSGALYTLVQYRGPLIGLRILTEHYLEVFIDDQQVSQN